MQQVERFLITRYHYFDICDNCANVRSRNNKMFAALRVLLCVSFQICFSLPSLLFSLLYTEKLNIIKQTLEGFPFFAFSNDEHFCVIMAKRFWNICCKVLALNSYEEIETILLLIKIHLGKQYFLGIEKFSHERYKRYIRTIKAKKFKTC